MKDNRSGSGEDSMGLFSCNTNPDPDPQLPGEGAQAINTCQFSLLNQSRAPGPRGVWVWGESPSSRHGEQREERPGQRVKFQNNL